MRADLHIESPEVHISPTFIDMNRSKPQLLISELFSSSQLPIHSTNYKISISNLVRSHLVLRREEEEKEVEGKKKKYHNLRTGSHNTEYNQCLY